MAEVAGDREVADNVGGLRTLGDTSGFARHPGVTAPLTRARSWQRRLDYRSSSHGYDADVVFLAKALSSAG
jgi:hypothetical protein